MAATNRNCIAPTRREFIASSVVLATGLCGPLPFISQDATAATDILPVAAWETRFLQAWNRDHYNSFLPFSVSADSWNYYGLAYGVDGNLAMFEATDNRDYLNRAILYVNNVIADARQSSTISTSQFKDSYLGWVNHSHPGIGDDGNEYPLFESYLWRYVTRLLRIIKARPDLYAAYRSQYDAILAFTEVHIFDKWYNRSVNSYIYRSNTHMASHWAYIALDLWLLSTNATRKQRSWAVFKNISSVGMPNYRGANIRAQLRPHPAAAGGYFWNDNWNSYSRPGSDVSHGGNMISFIVEAIDVGKDWDRTDAKRFIVTLNRAIWKTSSRYANYVDGSGSGNGWFNEGWCKLGRYSAALQRRLEGHTVGRNTQLFGNGALNAKILSQAS